MVTTTAISEPRSTPRLWRGFVFAYGSGPIKGGDLAASARWLAKTMGKSTARFARPYSVSSESPMDYNPLRAVACERNALVLPRPIQRGVQ
jgi:hypothetical protein